MDVDVHFSSQTVEWETPQWLFDELNAKYGPFEIDVAATDENAKCPAYFTAEESGLYGDWEGARCFMNPPYGREIGKWVKKACDEATIGGALVVCLLPARTDTKWFHDYCLPFGKVEFLRGRLTFGNAINPAPFPSMIVVFGER